jgi:methylthioribose-1-phosphate isomerase
MGYRMLTNWRVGGFILAYCDAPRWRTGDFYKTALAQTSEKWASMQISNAQKPVFAQKTRPCDQGGILSTQDTKNLNRSCDM